MSDGNEGEKKEHSVKSQNQDLRQTLAALVGAALVGIGGVSFYALTAGTSDKVLPIIGGGLLISGAALLLGSLFGFLFGIPKTIEQARSPDVPSLGQQPAGAAAGENQGQAGQQPAMAPGDTMRGDTQENRGRPYRVNTNLEEISDWLTKILVGVGLTQLSTLPDNFWLVAGKFVGALGGSSNDTAVHAVAAALIAHFLATGFFFGYLITRLFLTGAFMRAELSPLEQEVRAVRVEQELARQAVRVEQERTRQHVDEVTERTKDMVSELSSQVAARPVEVQMFNSLYLPPPSGFQVAIQTGEEFIKNSPEKVTANIWVNLACAYGQQYDWEQKNQKPQAVLDKIKAKALRATQKAVEKDTEVRSRLAHFLHPQQGALDDDLKVFQGDDEFERLLGKS